MTLKEITPCIRQFKMFPQESDADYGSCLWGTITLDCDNYVLSAETDCGSYSYKWKPTPYSESFVHLMCRIGEDYLLGKIAEESVFDISASKESTLLGLAETEIPNDALDEIREIDQSSSEETFFRMCDEALRGNNLMDSWEYIHIVKRYPAGAVAFVKVFCDSLQPLLKKEHAHGN